MKKKPHILVVDDDFVATEALEHVLKKRGFIAKIIHEGGEAKKEVKKGSYDLVLLDIKLPLSEVDGWDVLLQMKSDPETASIPTVILSNAGLSHEVTRGMELGADAYLLKAHTPISGVVDRIEELLQA